MSDVDIEELREDYDYIQLISSDESDTESDFNSSSEYEDEYIESEEEYLTSRVIRKAASEEEVLKRLLDARMIRKRIDDIYDDNKIALKSKEEIAEKIVENFTNPKIISQTILAPTQSGKTAIMAAVMKKMAEKYLKTKKPIYYIPSNNHLLSTALNDNDWREQTKLRFPRFMEDNIFHLTGLVEKISIMENEENFLLIIDEAHIARDLKKSLNLAFKKAGLYNKNKLFKHNIKILQFSATPAHLLYSIRKWPENTRKIIYVPPPEYYGVDKLLENGLLRDAINLSNLSKSRNPSIISKEKESIYKNYKNILHDMKIKRITRPINIIRIDVGSGLKVAIEMIERLKNDYNITIDVVLYMDITPRINDEFVKTKQCIALTNIKKFQKFINTKPTNITIILIKNKLRCAQTLNLQYINMMFDNYTKNPKSQSIETVLQSLAGRATGYKDSVETITYTNIEKVIKYNKQRKSNFEKIFERDNQKTFIDKDNFDLGQEEKAQVKKVIYSHVEFDSYEELDAYYKKYFSHVKNLKSLPEKSKFSSETLYKEPSKQKVLTVDEAIKYGKDGLKTNKDGNNYGRYVIGYEDPTDPATVRHILVYKLVENHKDNSESSD